MLTGNYELKTDKDKMVFSTSFFRAEKTSVLHSGVYSKEFTSILFASGLCTLTYMIISFAGIESSFVRYLLVILVLIVAFIGSRKFIFKDAFLEVQFDKSSQTVNIIKHGVVTSRCENIPFDHISTVELGTKIFTPENSFYALGGKHSLFAKDFYKSLGLSGSIIASYIILTIATTTGAYFMKWNVKKYIAIRESIEEFGQEEVRIF